MTEDVSQRDVPPVAPLGDAKASWENAPSSVAFYHRSLQCLPQEILEAPVTEGVGALKD